MNTEITSTETYSSFKVTISVYPGEKFHAQADPLGVLDLLGLLDVVVYLEDMKDENSAGTTRSSPGTRCSPSRPR
ncbi:hypothetical protein ADL19_31575 [Streptomyces purpurogeneiscleroticus]|nr:hypothetical protein ADL19_31575 [Streptomyces purpurogeneiscleroticus]